jgi:hypothetical protein
VDGAARVLRKGAKYMFKCATARATGLIGVTVAVGLMSLAFAGSATAARPSLTVSGTCATGLTATWSGYRVSEAEITAFYANGSAGTTGNSFPTPTRNGIVAAGPDPLAVSYEVVLKSSNGRVLADTGVLSC